MVTQMHASDGAHALTPINSHSMMQKYSVLINHLSYSAYHIIHISQTYLPDCPHPFELILGTVICVFSLQKAAYLFSVKGEINSKHMLWNVATSGTLISTNRR